jgi:2-polyprenyl-3-methyl-5-hydroxy-6-metoxy-1,4-benzoquinol methylase
MTAPREIHALFAGLPLRERLHVLLRDVSAPLVDLARRAPSGRVLDLGCGHGLVSALLAAGRQDRQVLGVDVDGRKVAHARRALAPLSNVTVREADAAALLQAEAGSFDAIVVADVLYLLPLAAWSDFLATCRALLRTGGVLLLKEAEADGSWRHWKCVAQEWLMVRALGATRGSGGLQLAPRQVMLELLGGAGFAALEVHAVGRGYSTPHVLYQGVAAAG